MTKLKRLLNLKTESEVGIAYRMAANQCLDAPAESVVSCIVTDASSHQGEQNLSLSPLRRDFDTDMYAELLPTTNVYSVVNRVWSTLKSEFSRLCATIRCRVSPILTDVNQRLQHCGTMVFTHSITPREQHSGFWFFPCVYSCNESLRRKLIFMLIQTGCSHCVGRL